MDSEPQPQNGEPYSREVQNKSFMRLALEESKNSPPKPTNFCVGACLVVHNPTTLENTLLATGYTLECPGNTHAEQSALLNFASSKSCSVDSIPDYLPKAPSEVWLYTTMEPCNQRSAGNLPCVDRILALKDGEGKCMVRKVLVGVSEPETFVGVNEGRRKLEDAGVKVEVVEGFEKEILEVATAGHKKEGN